MRYLLPKEHLNWGDILLLVKQTKETNISKPYQFSHSMDKWRQWTSIMQFFSWEHTHNFKEWYVSHHRWANLFSTIRFCINKFILRCDYIHTWNVLPFVIQLGTIPFTIRVLNLSIHIQCYDMEQTMVIPVHCTYPACMRMIIIK